MSTSMQLLPSPDDRLDPVAAIVRWWTSGLVEIFATGRPAIVTAEEIESAARRRLHGSVSIALPTDDIFVSRATLPPGSRDAHRKALMLRLRDLAPVDPALLEISVRRTPEANGEAGLSSAVYAVAMARTQKLAALEEKARGRGARSVRFHAEGEDSVWLLTSRARKTQARGRIADMALALALAASAVAATGAATRALERQTEALLTADQSSRRASVEAERIARDAELASDLVARGVLRRRAGEALADLSVLNAATPDGAWWTRAQWTPEEVTLVGAGAQAAEAIETLSTAASGWSIALAGPVRASDAEGAQTFELRATKRGGDDGD